MIATKLSSSVATVLAVLFLSCLVGCPDEESEVICTLIAYRTLNVRVLNQDGTVVSSESLRVEYEQAASGVWRECTQGYASIPPSAVDETHDDYWWVCGSGASDIRVRASTDENSTQVSEFIDLPLTTDGCHVLTQDVTLSFE